MELVAKGWPHVVLLEFFRGLAEGTSDHSFKVATKTQAYSSTLLHLRQSRGPGVEVLQQTYIMSCHGKVDMTRWAEQLLVGWWGVTGKALRSILRLPVVDCMTECVEGNHEITNVRRSLMVEE